jgi:hypothetical protein
MALRAGHVIAAPVFFCMLLLAGLGAFRETHFVNMIPP